MSKAKRKAKRINHVEGRCEMAIPQNFEAAKILDTLSIKADAKQNLKDAMYYILNAISSLQNQKKQMDYYEENGFIPLQSKILNEVCGNRYKKAVSLLHEHNVIEVNDQYWVGVHSMGYRLTEAYASADLEYRELQGKIIREKYLERAQEQERLNKEELAKVDYITKWFDGEYLKIDVEQTHAFIEFYRSSLVSQLNSIKDKLTLQDFTYIENRITQRVNYAINTVEQFSKGDFLLSMTGKDHRLHSRFGNIKKELRAFITFKEKKLVGLDIMSSQPYLFTQLLKKEFYTESSDQSITALYPEIPDSTHILSEQAVNDIIMCVGSSQNADKQNIAKVVFLTIDWTKDFYNQLMVMEDQVKSSNGKKYFQTRAVAKKSILMILYDKNNGNKNGAKVFRQLFPTENRIIELFNQSDQHGFLPILLQRLESLLILKHTCKRISELLPNAPILTVHDCVYTTEEYADQVKEIMYNTLTEQTGIKPGIKVDKLSIGSLQARIKETAENDFKQIRKSLTRTKGKKRLMGYEKKIHLKKPLLFKIPETEGKKVIMTRYVDLSKLDNLHDND